VGLHLASARGPSVRSDVGPAEAGSASLDGKDAWEIAAEYRAPPDSEGAEGLPPLATPVYLIACLALIALAVFVLEYNYSSAPVPPGVDPGDWIQRSFVFIGRPIAPPMAIGSPYLYPPFLFPFVGASVLIAGGPLGGGFLFGGAVLAAFGVSTLLLGYRALSLGPDRVAFVGLTVLNGTLLSMLFWGAYPNFLGFVFVNLAIFFLLGFLRTERPLDALGLWIAASLTYLTHSLTFVVLVGTVALIAVLFLLTRRFDWRWLRNRGHQIGLAILAGTVIGYSVVTDYLGIPHPDYLFANPAAYSLDNLGELFVPLASAPTLTPSAPAAYLPSAWVLALLLGLVVLCLIMPPLVQRRRPAWLTSTLLVGAGWTAAALLLPAGGWLAHIDTDYTRFVYFLPEPIFLLALAVVERSAGGLIGPGPDPRDQRATTQRQIENRKTRPARLAWHAAVAVGLLLIVVNVSLPVAAANERANTGSAHDGEFLNAIGYLADSPRPGSVLTVQGAARWVEALTARGAYDIGPTWLLFENWQVTNAEWAYWALNSYAAVTNNEAVFSYSGAAGSVLSQAPMYSVYEEGVLVPVLRALPGATLFNVTSQGRADSVALSALGAPLFSPFGGSKPGMSLIFAGSTVWVEVNATLGYGGQAWVNYTVVPRGGDNVSGVRIELAPPPFEVPSLHTDGVPTVTPSPGGFNWSLSASLGQLPTPVTVSTSGSFAPRPQSSTFNGSGSPNSLSLSFANPSPNRAMTISLALRTSGASNPATTLPEVMLTEQLLASYNIHFLLVPLISGYAQTIAFYQLNFQFRTVFQDSEWILLEGG
jgi:hypothetical protein